MALLEFSKGKNNFSIQTEIKKHMESVFDFLRNKKRINPRDKSIQSMSIVERLGSLGVCRNGIDNGPLSMDIIKKSIDQKRSRFTASKASLNTGLGYAYRRKKHKFNLFLVIIQNDQNALEHCPKIAHKFLSNSFGICCLLSLSKKRRKFSSASDKSRI